MGACRSKTSHQSVITLQPESIVAERNPLGKSLLELCVRTDAGDQQCFRVSRHPNSTIRSLLEHLAPQLTAVINTGARTNVSDSSSEVMRQMMSKLRVTFSDVDLARCSTLEEAGIATVC